VLQKTAGAIAEGFSRLVFGFLLRYARHFLRWRVRGPLDGVLRSRSPFVVAYWHQDVLHLQHYICLRAGVEGRRRLVTLSSQSVDGEVGFRLLHPWGYAAVRGSSGKEDAGSALRDLARELRGGAGVVLASDGPQPPPFRMRKGPVWLARETGAPLFVARAWGKPQLLVPRTWFRMSIPLPRSEVVVLSEGPVDVSGTLEEARLRAEAALERLRVEADAMLYLPQPRNRSAGAPRPKEGRV
jgi:hypothetical protein